MKSIYDIELPNFDVDDNHIVKPGRSARSEWLSAGRSPWGDDESLLRVCKRSGCMNPDHHRVMPRIDAMIIAARRRNPAGKDGRSPLTKENVLAIRKARKNGFTVSVIAEVYGVSVTTVHNILSGKTWGWFKESDNV